ncbi:hypothetical protein [Lachnospira multipara]|nr:hypothetical protein [Lachnospira multipara]
MEDQKEWLEMAIEALKQESCEDCVSREELKKWLDMNFSFGGALRKLELFDRLDKELPSVTPTLKWIPVSERLPEPKNYGNKDFSSWVRVTVKPKHFLLKAYVTEAHYCFSEEKWYTTEMEWGEEITAWQPLLLPKPYKAEMEVEHD